MTDKDLIERLRHGAENIHSIGPARAAALLEEAAAALAGEDQIRKGSAARATLGVVSRHKPASIESLVDFLGLGDYMSEKLAEGKTRMDEVRRQLKPGEPEETPPLHGLGIWRQPPPGYRNEHDAEFVARVRAVQDGGKP
jgi:hypothetical protein